MNLLPRVRQQLLGLLVPIDLGNGTMVDCLETNQNPGQFAQLNFAVLDFYRQFKILLQKYRPIHDIWNVE